MPIRRKFHGNFNGTFTTSRRDARNVGHVMRCEFVLKLSSETLPDQCRFDGWIEEVHSGKERRFRTTDELLAFLKECFETSRPRAPKSGDG
jgi:hypothetical protein